MSKHSNINSHNPHHHQHSSTAGRNANHTSRSAELISAEALQHVVRPLKKARPQSEEPEREDPVGDRMTNILNAHPDFSFDPNRRSERHNTSIGTEGFTLFPLFCSRNWAVLKRKYQRIRSTSPLMLLLSCIGFCYENAPSRQRIFETFHRTLLLLLCLILAGMSILVVASHFAIKIAGQAAFLLLVQASMLLFDWKDLQDHMPSQIKWIGGLLFWFADWMDQHLFLRKRYAGREWNATDFEFSSTLSGKSRHEPLMSLPPPCIQDAGQQLCLDPRYMTRMEWGQETSKHVVAINFCYLMMREDQQRKRSTRSSQPTQDGISTTVIRAAELSSDSFGEPTETFSAEYESGSNKILQIMSMPTPSGQNTDHVLGWSCNSPSGAIELVRNSQHIQRRQTSNLSSAREEQHLELSDDSMAAETPTHLKFRSRDDISIASSVKSCSSAVAADMNWVDISARIGMQVLKSSHLQRVVASEEAAERLKTITDQFVAGPQANDAESNTFEVRSLKEFSVLKQFAKRKVPQSVPRSPCRPVHSMWTSAAAAASVGSSDEESTIATMESGWKESKSGDMGDFPHAPPKIIRTKQFPTNSSLKKQAIAAEFSPVRSIDNVKRNRVLNLDGGRKLDSEELALSVFLEEESHEIIDPAHSAFHHCVDENGKDTSCKSIAGSHHTERKVQKRSPLEPGTKVAAPFFPLQPGRRRVGHSNYQMATVVSSKRIFVDTGNDRVKEGDTNCLSVTCKVDKSFLRNGDFAELTFRVMDEWSSRYMPKHSKVPIGACVATAFGIGVVVGWRVEDDCHVIRSLWNRRGAGAAHAYLNRDAIHGVVEAAVGFEVQTKCGSGIVQGYVDAGRTYENGRYVVALQDEGVYKNCVVTLNRNQIFACHGAQFIPVIEHIKEACDYQIMLDTYRALVRQQAFNELDSKGMDDHIWKFCSENLETLWKSFLKAVEEDSEFDEGVDNFMGSVIEFLEQFDNVQSSKKIEGNTEEKAQHDTKKVDATKAAKVWESETKIPRSSSEDTESQEQDAGFWILNDMLGGIFSVPKKVIETRKTSDDEARSRSYVPADSTDVPSDENSKSKFYKQAFAVVRILMKTVALARAASTGKPQFRLALTICRELLMFVRTVLKIQQKNNNPESLELKKKSLQEISSTFGPIKERLEKIGRGITQRMERQGRRAKIRVLRFADRILADELFFLALCQGDWKQCLMRIETSLVKANVIDEASCGHYRKTACFLYEHMMHLSSSDTEATQRNSEKLAKLAKIVQLLAAPKRSILKLIRNNEVLTILERILIRVFCREKEVTRTLTIHATNFKSLRHLRILKNVSVSGKMWIPLLDAADEEFSYMVSRMPENAKEFVCPLSSIFSLAVAQFHKINAGDLTRDWLDFLMEEDATRIIHDIDMKLILGLSSFSRDVKDMMTVIPYYPSIDEDILNLMDEVKIDKFLKEASEAIDDEEKLADFIRKNVATAIERFLAYLPKLSIPVERRELGEGWVLTVGQKGGGDLTLSDVKVKRENLVCRVMGGDALSFPIKLFGEDDTGKPMGAPGMSSTSKLTESDHSEGSDRIEESILDHIREMILQAQRHGTWTVGVGGVGQPPSDPYVAGVLQNLPITSVLSCAIDLWRNLEIDDDELLEIAIRDVSYQIQLHKEMEEKGTTADSELRDLVIKNSSGSCMQSSLSNSASFEQAVTRFNPRVDPTVLFLEMKNLTLHLERFRFRIEKSEKRTVFDPVFEGCGTVSIQNLSLLVRVECARERIGKVGSSSSAPVLLLRELEVEIENVRLQVEDTGADWLLNKAVKGFSENITDVVESNLKEQIKEQTKLGLEQLNSYFAVNQEILLNLLGISLDDLEEHIIWV